MAANPDMPEIPDEAPAALAVPSKLDDLRAAFQERITDPRLYKKLPAAGGRLVAEYRVLTTAETEEIFGGQAETRDQNADSLIRALVSIRLHEPDHQDADERGTVDLAGWAGVDLGGPLRFDKRLLDTLTIDLEDTSARSICLRMFNGNEIAMAAQSTQLGAWMTDTTTETLQDFALGS